MALLEPRPGTRRPETTEGPAADRVPDGRASGTPGALRADLVRLLDPENILHTLPDLVKYASDAGPYRFVPQFVVIAESVDDALSRPHRRGGGAAVPRGRCARRRADGREHPARLCAPHSAHPRALRARDQKDE
jgi:hypothetical protein